MDGKRFRLRVVGDAGRKPRAEGERQWTGLISGARLAAATAENRALYPEAATLPPLPTRAECKDAPRPCMLARCRYHVGVDLMLWQDGRFRGLRELKGWETDGRPTCALDVADSAPAHNTTVPGRGEHRGLPQTEVAKILGYTRSGLDWIERTALAKLKEGMLDAGVDERVLGEVLASLGDRGDADGPAPLDGRDDGSRVADDDGAAGKPPADERVFAPKGKPWRVRLRKGKR